MMNNQFVDQKLKEYQIKEYILKSLAKAGYSHTEIHKTPLGEKIIIFTTRPGLVVGKKGDNIKRLTNFLKTKFKLENPQIEIGDVENPMLDAQYASDRIAYSLERFGQKRFKSIGYKVLQDIMDSGAIGAEVVLSGKLPAARATSWRFSAGYLKKSGDIHQNYIKRSINKVDLKAGTVGIKVSIMTPDIELPDKFLIKKEEKVIQVEELKEEIKAKQPEEDLKAKEIQPEETKKSDAKEENKEKKIKEIKPKSKKKDVIDKEK